MKTIYRYSLKMTDIQSVTMPRGAVLLSVDVRDENREYPDTAPNLWALVDTEEPNVLRDIGIHGSGHDITRWLNAFPNATFLSTFQLAVGRLIFHAFDYGERGQHAREDQSGTIQSGQVGVARRLRLPPRGQGNRS